MWRLLLVLLCTYSSMAYEHLAFRITEIRVTIDYAAFKQAGFKKAEVVNTTRKALRLWTKASGRKHKIVKEGNLKLVPFDGNALLGYYLPNVISSGEVLDAEVGLATVKLSGNKSLLLAVLLHEFGHALGLNHSTVQDSIMYPYVFYTKKIHLDDEIGVKTWQRYSIGPS